MKKTILKLSVIILMTVLMLLIPPTANAETNYKFDYSQIKALEGQTQKYYEMRMLHSSLLLKYTFPCIPGKY